MRNTLCKFRATLASFHSIRPASSTLLRLPPPPPACNVATSATTSWNCLYTRGKILGALPLQTGGQDTLFLNIPMCKKMALQAGRQKNSTLFLAEYGLEPSSASLYPCRGVIYLASSCVLFVALFCFILTCLFIIGIFCWSVICCKIRVSVINLTTLSLTKPAAILLVLFLLCFVFSFMYLKFLFGCKLP